MVCLHRSTRLNEMIHCSFTRNIYFFLLQEMYIFAMMFKKLYTNLKLHFAVIILGMVCFYLFMTTIPWKSNSQQSQVINFYFKDSVNTENLSSKSNISSKEADIFNEAKRGQTTAGNIPILNDIQSLSKKFKFLAKKYAINNTLIIAVTDLGYVEMALNLYQSSFKRFQIDNYLFVCSHEKAEEFLKFRNIHAISLWNDSLSTKESLYGEKGYRNKTNFKTDSVMMTLELGINIFLVDVDLVFLKNPLPFLSQFTTSYDLVIQGGLQTLNSGDCFQRLILAEISIQTRQVNLEFVVYKFYLVEIQYIVMQRDTCIFGILISIQLRIQDFPGVGRHPLNWRQSSRFSPKIDHSANVARIPELYWLNILLDQLLN